MITSPASASQQHAKLSMWVANAKREPGGAVAELVFFGFRTRLVRRWGFLQVFWRRLCSRTQVGRQPFSIH